jgi:hypothetical protein
MLLDDSIGRKSSSRRCFGFVISQTSKNTFCRPIVNDLFVYNILMNLSYTIYTNVFQVHEYLFFSGLMLADTLLLVYLSYSYKYKSFRQRLTDDENSNENTVTIQNEVQLDEK